MKERSPIFWDRKMSQKDIVRILRDESGPRFAEIAALLLSRTNKPKEVFKDYLDTHVFCRNWRKIKRQMRTNRWNDEKIIFWDEVYKVVAQTVGKGTVQKKETRFLDIDPEIKEIIDVMKSARNKEGLTQGELGEKAGVSQQTISFVEKGYVNISIRTLKKIADALGLKITLTERQNLLKAIARGKGI